MFVKWQAEQRPGAWFLFGVVGQAVRSVVSVSLATRGQN
jgi:hypothetical protein